MARKVMTSHELAVKLFNTAKLLLTKQDVELPGVEDAKITVEYYDREPFLNTVQVMGSGRKEFGSYHFQFIPDNSILVFQVPRSQVCKKIQEEKWECVPLMNTEEFTNTRE